MTSQSSNPLAGDPMKHPLSKGTPRDALMQRIQLLRQENQELDRRMDENRLKMKMLARQVEELEKMPPPSP